MYIIRTNTWVSPCDYLLYLAHRFAQVTLGDHSDVVGSSWFKFTYYRPVILGYIISGVPLFSTCRLEQLNNNAYSFVNIYVFKAERQTVYRENVNIVLISLCRIILIMTHRFSFRWIRSTLIKSVCN